MKTANQVSINENVVVEMNRFLKDHVNIECDLHGKVQMITLSKQELQMILAEMDGE